jgi:membrane-associated phospholipid phosphatase
LALPVARGHDFTIQDERMSRLNGLAALGPGHPNRECERSDVLQMSSRSRTAGPASAFAMALAILGLGLLTPPAFAASRGEGEVSAAARAEAPEGGEPRPVERRRFWPRRSAWREAARRALRDPGTWVPAGMAGVIAAGGWDQEISDWAVAHTPVFGSVENASTWTERLHAAGGVGMIATALAVHADEDPWRLRGKTLLVEGAGAIASASLAELLKSATGRERPDGSSDTSFPSGHATPAFAFAAASRRNLEAMQLGRGWRIGLIAGCETLAAGTAWARVEAQKHYPTDVLVGAALGNYISLFVHDAFLGSSPNLFVSVNVDPGRPSFAVAMSF